MAESAATSRIPVTAFPEKIGKYDIINAIGAGSTGSVYLSHDPYFRRDVAIKVYDVVEDEDGAALFFEGVEEAAEESFRFLNFNVI